METGLIEPEEVLKCTKKYQNDNDKFSEFIEEYIEYNPYDETIYHSITSVYDLYKRWARRLEKLRTQNEQLRESVIWWHETCKATVSELYGLIEELKYTIKRIEK